MRGISTVHLRNGFYALACAGRGHTDHIWRQERTDSLLHQGPCSPLMVIEVAIIGDVSSPELCPHFMFSQLVYMLNPTLIQW
jgi:hypothetical protein